jgi:hypothetical protein
MIYKMHELRTEQMEEMVAAARAVFGVRYDDLTNYCRSEPLASVRGLVASILHLEMCISQDDISSFLKRHRSSISYYVQNHSDRMITDRRYQESYHALKSKLEEK